MDYMKMQMLKEQIKDLDDKNQIIMLGENAKIHNWWASILITGLGQMLQGRVGRGVAMLLFGWLTFGIVYLWGIFDAHSYEKDTNQYIDMIVFKRLKELKGDV